MLATGTSIAGCRGFRRHTGDQYWTIAAAGTIMAAAKLAIVVLAAVLAEVCAQQAVGVPPAGSLDKTAEKPPSGTSVCTFNMHGKCFQAFCNACLLAFMSRTRFV